MGKKLVVGLLSVFLIVMIILSLQESAVQAVAENCAAVPP